MSADFKASAVVLLAACLCGCECGPEGRRAPEGPVLLRDAGTGVCPHPLFPLVEGARWSYELGAGERSRRTRARIEVVEVTPRGRAQTAKIRRTVGSMETIVEATCGTDGASFLGVFVPLGPPLPAAASASPTPTKRTGALVPQPHELRAGAEWQYLLEAHTEMTSPSPLTMDSEWSVRARYLREDEVTVPAGRYHVTRLRLVVTVHHRPPEERDIVLSDRAMDPPPMTFTYSLARGVGVVLIEGEPMPERPRARARWALTEVARGD